jgi:hypothetical protein
MNAILDEMLTIGRISDKHDFELKNIVVAVDLSPYSESTAAYAAGLARVFGASGDQVRQ